MQRNANSRSGRASEGAEAAAFESVGEAHAADAREITGEIRSRVEENEECSM